MIEDVLKNYHEDSVHPDCWPDAGPAPPPDPGGKQPHPGVPGPGLYWVDHGYWLGHDLYDSYGER